MKVLRFSLLSLILVLPRILIAQTKAESHLNALIPDLAVVQYAGNIGCVSVGTGWDYGKNDRWETQLLLGYLPSSVMNKDMFTLTLRESLKPWRIVYGENFSLHPAVFAMNLNWIMNDEFWIDETSKYPKRIYHFSSALRLHIGLGSRLNWHLPARKTRRGDVLSFYYEVSTYDLALVNAYSNIGDISFRDLFAIGVGIQYRFCGTR